MTDTKDLFYPCGKLLYRQNEQDASRTYYGKNHITTYSYNGDPHIPNIQQCNDEGIPLFSRIRDPEQPDRYKIHSFTPGRKVTSSRNIYPVKSTLTFEGREAIKVAWDDNNCISSYYDAITGRRFAEKIKNYATDTATSAYYDGDLPHGIAETYYDGRLFSKKLFDKGVPLWEESMPKRARTSFHYTDAPNGIKETKESYSFITKIARKRITFNDYSYIDNSYEVVTANDDYTDTMQPINWERHQPDQHIYIRATKQSYLNALHNTGMDITRDGNNVIAMSETWEDAFTTRHTITHKDDESGWGLIFFHDTEGDITHADTCRIRTVKDKDFDRLLVPYSRLSDKPTL